MQRQATRSQKITVISFFVILFLLLVGSMMVTGTLQDITSEKSVLHVAFHESVTGLRPGNPVTLSGVQVGQVKDIHPMTVKKARDIVKKAKVIYHPDHWQTGEKEGQVLDGTTYLETSEPFVLVTVEVDQNAIPLNRLTRVSLITTTLTGSQAVRFVAGKMNSLSSLEGRPVVLDADHSPMTRMKSKFIDEQKGVLNETNVKNFGRLLENLKKISQRMERMFGAENQHNLKQMIRSHRNVARTMENWVSERSNSGKLTRVLERLDRLVQKVEHLVTSETKKDGLSSLLQSANEITVDVKQTVQSLHGMVDENRKRVSELIQNMNKLAERVNLIATQLDQDPSSAIFGRRGKEIQAPFEHSGPNR